MYGWTAAELTGPNSTWLKQQPLWRSVDLVHDSLTPGTPHTLGMFHGSPDDPDEFLFMDTPDSRFRDLAAATSYQVITVGHSHSPFHKQVGPVHFINPGSTGRMFDGDSRASCAVLELDDSAINVTHYRVEYPVETVMAELERLRMPRIYQEMYRIGRKLN